MTMTDDDKEFFELIAERAATKAAEKVMLEVDKKIASHLVNCPVGMKIKTGSAFLAGIALPFTLIGGLAGAFGSKLFEYLRNP